MNLVPSMNRRHLVLVALFMVVRLGLSILVYRNPGPAFFPDSPGYERLGIGLLQGTAYGWIADDKTELFRPPGYPAFIALTYGLLGRNAGSLALLQLGLGGVIIFLLYDLGFRLHSPRAGLVAAGLYALDPFSAIWGLAVLSETLFTALVFFGLYGLVRWHLERREAWLVFAGMAGGLSALVRPIGLLLLPLWALMVFLTDRRRQRPEVSLSLKSSDTNTIIFSMVFLLIVIPWSIRNKIVWDVLNISNVATRNLERYLAPAVIAERDGVSLEEARLILMPPDDLSAASRTAWYADVIWSNPFHYASAHLKGTLRTIAGIEYTGWFEFLELPAERAGMLLALESGDPIGILERFAAQISKQLEVSVVALISLGYQILLYVAALLGFRKMYRRQPWTIALLVATGLILILVPGVVGEDRFRVPIQPILALMAGVGIVSSKSRQ